MRNTSCTNPVAAKRAAERTVKQLSEEKRKEYGINDDNKSDFIQVLSDIIEATANAKDSIEERNAILDDTKGFIKSLDDFFMISKVSELEKEIAEEQKETFKEQWINRMGANYGFYDKFGLIEFDDNTEDNENAKQLENILNNNFSKVLSLHTRLYNNDNIKSISYVVRDIQINNDNRTPQQVTLDKIEKINKISHTYVGKEFTPKDSTIKGTPIYVQEKRGKYTIPNGYIPTGKSKYIYNGQEVITEPVSGISTKNDYPILSNAIGIYVDNVGRKVFAKDLNLFDKDGSFKYNEQSEKNDKILQNIIDAEFGSIFTPNGFRNIIKDFIKLKGKLEKKWGDGSGESLQYFSGNLWLYGKTVENGKEVWKVGKPDLLVIDPTGMVHVIDFKTFKMQVQEGIKHKDSYQDLSTFDRGQKFSHQETDYIRILQSHGLDVDQSAYIVQIDTWYDSHDKGDYNTDPENDIYYNDDGTLGILEKSGDEGMTLGKYSEINGVRTRQEILDNTSEVILYMEPRLHLDNLEDEDSTNGLRESDNSEGQIVFDNAVQYQRQWELLSDEDKENLEILFGKQSFVRPARGIVTLDPTDVESNPDLIGSQEITTIANLMMYTVSNYITALQNGASYKTIPVSQPINTEGEPRITPLMGKSRYDIIKAVGIYSLIDIAFKGVSSKYHKDFPTLEEYRNDDYDHEDYEFEDEDDYLDQRKFNEKAKWLMEPHHKQQFIMAGYNKLISLENSIIPTRNKEDDDNRREFNKEIPAVQLRAYDIEATGEDGDESSLNTYADEYIEGLSDTEAWMLNQRNYSPKASLAQEVRRVFESLFQKNADGSWIKDQYGWGFRIPVDSTMAIQTVYDATRNCETIEEMESALDRLASVSGNEWVQQILDKINADKNLKKKFYRHFRKDTLLYSITEWKQNPKTGKREAVTRIINMKNAFYNMKNSLNQSFARGSVGSYTFKIDNKTYTLPFVSRSEKTGKNAMTIATGSTSVGHIIMEDIDTWRDRLKELYKEGRKKEHGETKEEQNKWILQQMKEKTWENDNRWNKAYGGDDMTMMQAITKILQGVGIIVPQRVVENVCVDKMSGASTCNAMALLLNAREVVNNLSMAHEIPNSLTGNAGLVAYANSRKGILPLISSRVQEFIEASVYQDGKTYYTFTNPSRLQHIIRNLKDALSDPDKFKKYIKDNFERYEGWFCEKDPKTGKIVWLNDWVDQFVNDKNEARGVLSHKTEINFLGNQYRDLGELGFLRSLLHNYFGSRGDKVEKARWYALPTMSNKPVNEFIRMKSYNKGDTRATKAEVIKRVIMPTFKQEMNRIADVLYHYANSSSIAVDKYDITDKILRKAKWTNTEIESLKERIRNRKITVEDFNRLGRMNGKLATGAKFHFLWYLNEALANEDNSELAERIVSRINKLLTPEEEREADDLSYEVDTNKMVQKLIGGSLAVFAEENEAKGLLDEVIERELKYMEKIGLFDTDEQIVNGKKIQVLKYQEEFGEDLEGNVDQMKEKVRNFLWDDIGANINIIQITGGDLAYYGDAVNYQKRIAQEHSPGLKVMHDPEYDDGYFRSVHVSDEHVRDEIEENVKVALEEYLEKNKNTMSTDAVRDYQNMITIITKGITDALVTDGQSYSSPTSMRKKLAMQGEWDDTREKAYNRIRKGDFNINDLGIMLQPLKPFVTSDMAKWSGSPTMELRRVPLQDKNSEYLIILAEALAEGSGKKSKLAAISKFMEASARKHDKKGIDTVHFESVNKVGKSGIIDLAQADNEFEKAINEKEEFRKEGRPVNEDDYNDWIADWMTDKVERDLNTENEELSDRYKKENQLMKEGTLKPEEIVYNTQYVDTIPVEDYIIQQEVPAHLLEHEQLYGSQIRILGISDITEGTQFDVDNEVMSDKELVDEYKKLHAENIKAAFDDLMEELGLNNLETVHTNDGEQLLDKTTGEVFSNIMNLKRGTKRRNDVLNNLEFILQKELSKDAKYGLDMRRACWLRHDAQGNATDFVVPLCDPIQSKRIQMLLNSIVKKAINKQKINGGPAVQTTCYDQNLHVRFKSKKKDKNGEYILLKTFDEFGGSVEEYRDYVRKNQNGIAYFECYLSVPNVYLERLITNPDGSMMSVKEVQEKMPEIWKSMSQIIGYRIPTEDKYSMLPLKIKGFLPKAAGQAIMMPQEITFLTGSDFDIDKMYIMMKDFTVNYAKLDSKDREETIKNIIDTYIKEGHPSFRFMKRIVTQIVSNGNEILDGTLTAKAWLHGVQTDINGVEKEELRKKAQEFANWYRDYIFKSANVLKEYKNKDSKNRTIARKARNNRLLDLQWAVLTNEDTASKMLNPGNFDNLKKEGRIIRIRKAELINPKTRKEYTEEELYNPKVSVSDLDSILEDTEEHNTTLTTSKLYFQHQNMQGSQMTGIIANNTVSHAFCSFQKIGVVLNDGVHDNSLTLDRHVIGDMASPSVLDAQKGFNGQLVSKDIATYLDAVLDTAKDPVASDFNLNTFTGKVAMALARLGFDEKFINYFLAQPVLMRLSDLKFKNSTDGYYDDSSAILELATELGMKDNEIYNTEALRGEGNEYITKETLWDHMKDEDFEENNDNFEFQKMVLVAYNIIYTIAKDLVDLTFMTKFNSVTNAGGPTIADTMEDVDRVNNFIEAANSGNTVFVSDTDGFTNAGDIVKNDPILRAFYNYTIGKDGALETIFKQFFPHYYKGFQNVRQVFKGMVLGDRKLSSKTYNQLLDDYIYYLMTYENHDDEDSEKDYAPTIPSSNEAKEYLIGRREGNKQKGGLVKRFDEVKKIYARYKKATGISNAILDQSVENNCLRIRPADEFLNADTLIFNGAQLDAQHQQITRDAWSDIITIRPNRYLSEDDAAKIRRFGVDLFFYTLMRNGFGFSPKTLMHLASVIVRYNAIYADGYNDYITGLDNLQRVDKLLMGNGTDSKDNVLGYIRQYMRNHSQNNQLIPNFSQFDKTITSLGETVEFTIPKSKEGQKRKLILSKKGSGSKTAKMFITVTYKDPLTHKLDRRLYEADPINAYQENEDTVTFTYHRVSELGLTNNFIEYNANDPDMKDSFFSEIRKDSVDSIDDEESPQGDSGDEKQEHQGFLGNYASENDGRNPLDLLMSRMRGRQSTNRKYRHKILQAIQNADNDSRLHTLANELLDNENQQTMDEMRAEFDKQERCGFIV